MLTLVELNRATLARQLLLERHELPLERAVERIAGLQAQHPPAPYVGLWSRLAGFRPETLTKALEQRRLVRATLMRGTIHLVSAEDWALFWPAVAPALRALWQRYQPDRRNAEGVDELAERALALAAERPRTAAELTELLAAGRAEDPRELWFRVRLHAPFVQVAPAGTLGSNARRTFGSGPAWLGRPPASGEEGCVHLVERYLAAFGPATTADLARWSGLQVSALRPAIAALEPRLRRLRDERGRSLLDLEDAPRPPAGTPAPPRLLPVWDSVLLAHADRTRVLPEAYRKTVINKRGDVLATFLVDGQVAGLWRIESGKLVLEPFERLPRPVRAELESEGEQLVGLLS